MTLDLETLSLPELKQLQARVQKAIASYEVRLKKRALTEVEEKARELGFNLAELLDVKPARASGLSGVPKFADPADPSRTWTGRGRKPAWFVEAIAAGKSPDDLAI